MRYHCAQQPIRQWPVRLLELSPERSVVRHGGPEAVESNSKSSMSSRFPSFGHEFVDSLLHRHALHDSRRTWRFPRASDT